ncbi:MAG: hypothetical protein WDW36_002539 [Sanguina aurantia]
MPRSRSDPVTRVLLIGFRESLDQHPMDQGKALSMARGRSRTMQRPISELQKWVQCNKCQKWRKVPYHLRDDELTDEWECKDNSWDYIHAICSIPQALSNEEIDEILALQEDVLEGGGGAAAAGPSMAMEDPGDDDLDMGYDDGDG